MHCILQFLGVRVSRNPGAQRQIFVTNLSFCEIDPQYSHLLSRPRIVWVAADPEPQLSVSSSAMEWLKRPDYEQSLICFVGALPRYPNPGNPEADDTRIAQL